MAIAGRKRRTKFFISTIRRNELVCLASLTRKNVLHECATQDITRKKKELDERSYYTGRKEHFTDHDSERKLW